MNQHEGAIARFKRIFFSNTKLSKRNRDNVLSMGVNSFGYTFFEEIVTSYMQFFYTEFMMLEAAIVSGVMSVGVIIDGVTDFLMGLIIDRVETKKGRLRHWFLWMAIPTGLAVMAIFMCQNSWSSGAKTIYLFIVYNVYCTFMTALRLPRHTMISMCFNDAEARQMANVGSGVLKELSQLIITAGLPLLLAKLGETASAYTNTSIVLAALGILFFIFSYFLAREVLGSKAAVETVRETEGEEAAEATEKLLQAQKFDEGGKERRRNPIKDFGILIANKYWIINTLTALANGIGIGFMFGVAAYFATYTLGSIAGLSGIFGTMSVGMMVGIFLVAPVIIKFDSRMVGVIGSFIGAIGMAFAAFGILVMHSIPMMYAGLFIRQIGTGFITSINGDMTARVIDYGEWKFGYRIDGLCFSGTAVMTKICSAVSTAILGFTLTAVGYKGGMGGDLPQSAINAINYMFLLVPCGAMILSGIFYMMLNLSNARIAQMRKEIAERAEKLTEK